ncbi:zinc DNA binding domain protein [Bacillus phage 015DV002]|nr:DNA binding protein [Bacillus phage 000TH008]QQO40714.1 DNA binding protein [Bacillus phage 000TH009]QQO41213.1 zinc DNA binding domain protein [Bacillus phage 015DV002]
MTKLAGYRVSGCNGCGKAYLVGESHDRNKCAECVTRKGK